MGMRSSRDSLQDNSPLTINVYVYRKQTRGIANVFGELRRSWAVVFQDPHMPIALTVVSTQKRGLLKSASHTIYGILFYFVNYKPAVVCEGRANHPAKSSEAITNTLSTSQGFDFERDVFPQEFRELLEKEGRVVNVDGSTEQGAGQKGDRKQGWVGR